MISHNKVNSNVRCSVYPGRDGFTEYFFVITCRDKKDFSYILNDLEKSLRHAVSEFDIPVESCVFSRFYLSDIANQENILRNSTVYNSLSCSSRSLIEQPPVDGKVTLLTYHLSPVSLYRPLKKIRGSGEENLFLKTQNYSLLYTVNSTAPAPGKPSVQTEKIFRKYKKNISLRKMTLLRNTIRTWIYVRDIDNNYMKMSDSRKRLFRQEGLNFRTRYIASTGIEARMNNHSSLVSMDAISLSGIDREQIVSMHAPGKMGSTHDYGVTFERGTRVRFGDRSHLYISGTASINTAGNILHLYDPEGQARRTIKNIRALLSAQGAGFMDVAYMIVYLRNTGDASVVSKVVTESVPGNIPLVFVQAAVCRPGWLVEIECVAVKPDKNGFKPFA